MTREEAEIIIDGSRKKHPLLDMAISALTEELSEDGTLTVHVKDGSKISRVFVMGDNIFGGLYYPDSAENKCFEGMTNGEVIQALFPNISVYEHGATYSVNNEYNFNSTWWNAPYKAESEGKE